jgi:hypothetical protein
MRLPTLISRLFARSNRPTTTPARLPVPLRVEELEARQVPTAQTANTFIATLYQGFLSRTVDDAGLAYWGNQFAMTGSTEAVARGILQSTEFQGRELEVLYQNFLGRPLSQEGLNYWGNILQSGASYAQVKSGVLGSDEFFAHRGGTNFDFLNAVYETQLGRPLDESGREYWGTQLAEGASRPTVTLEILESPDAEVVKVAGAYEEILGHGLTPAGASYWAGGLLSGQPDSWMYAGVAGSDEFIRQLNVAGAPQLADPNAGADLFLTQGHRFEEALPGAEVLDRNLGHGAVVIVAPPAPVVVTPVDGSPTPANPAPTTAVPGDDGSASGGDSAPVGDSSNPDGGDCGAPTDDSGDNPPADTGDNPPADTGDTPPADPGTDPGTDPGSDPTMDPGYTAPADPGTDPGSDPGSAPTADSGCDSGC